MNEEIKEILNDLQNEDCYWLDCGRKNTSLTDEEANLLLNYISNLQNRIDRTYKYVSQLSSKGRDCEIYYDIKKEILNNLKESGV